MSGILHFRENISVHNMETLQREVYQRQRLYLLKTNDSAL